MTKQIRVKLSYNGLSDKDVATQGVAVVDGMTNNLKLVNPPINPADLKTQVETFASLTCDTLLKTSMLCDMRRFYCWLQDINALPAAVQV